MTYHHSPTPRDASAPDSVSAAPALTEPAGAPDGAWFRRERERIAVGRRTIAQKLQVAESRVVALETRRQPVPGPWLPLLVALGFRLPSASAESAASASELKPAVPLPAADAPSAASSGEAQPSAAATAPSERVKVDAQPLPAASTPELPAKDLRDCEPPAAAAHSADLVAEAAPVPPSTASQEAQTFLPGEPAPAASEPPEAQTFLPGEPAPAASEPPEAQTFLPGEPAPTASEPQDAQTFLPGEPAPAASEPQDAQTFLPGEPSPAASEPHDAAHLPAARPSDPACPPAAPPPRHRAPADGGWLQAERERVGLSRNSLRQLLNVQWAAYAKIEQRKLPVPRRWWPKLKEVGFRFPGKPAPAVAPSVPAPPPAAPKLQVGLRGTWLRRQRQRLGLSDRDLWKALQVHWRTLTVVERHNRVIPAAWLPALERLGMTAAAGPEAASEPRPRSTPAASPPTATAAPLAAAPAQPEGEDVLSMIVKYRLALGRRSRQSAVEIMALIAHDLRTADLSQAITHDQLAAAMQSLLRARSAA